MPGLLDFLNTPQGIGLLSAVAGGMAGARRGTPINNLGRGLTTGLTGYQAAMDAQRQEQEKLRKKQAMADVFNSAMRPPIQSLPGRQAIPAQYKTDGKSFGTLQDAEQYVSAFDPRQELGMALNNEFGGSKSLPAETDFGQYASAPMVAPDMSPRMGIETILGVEGQPGQEARPGGLDRERLILNMMQNPEAGMQDVALKAFLEQKAQAEDKPQLVTVYGYDGRPMQKWIRPGESTGVDVGMGKPDRESVSSLGKLIAERDSLPIGHPARRLYEQAIDKAATHAPAAQMNNFGSPVAGIGPDGQPVFFQTSKTGGAPSIVSGVTPMPPKPVPPTGEENTAAGYLGRMKAAERLIGGLAGGEATVGTNAAASIPLIGSYAQQKAMTTKQQQYKQAADDWIRAKLRKESGAVIAADEMQREYETYFPIPGNDPATIKQKAMARRQAEEQMTQSAGRAAPQQTEVPLSNAEIDYIDSRRAAGVSDQEIAIELQQGAANVKIKPSAKLSPAEQSELEQLRKRFKK